MSFPASSKSTSMPILRALAFACMTISSAYAGTPYLEKNPSEILVGTVIGGAGTGLGGDARFARFVAESVNGEPSGPFR